MKVSILSTAYPYRGGIAVFTERLANAFQAEGDKVEINTFTLQYPSFLFPGKSQFSSSVKPKDLKITRAVNSVNPFNWIKVGNKIRKQRPDILILKYWIPFLAPCFGTISRIVKKNNHTKVIVILDNIIPHERRIGDSILSTYFINSVDACIAMSESVRQDLKRIDAKKLNLLSVHPLYDNFGKPISKIKAKKALGLQVDLNYMLFFGIIRNYKGLDLILEAMTDKILQKINTKLIVAGEFYENEKSYRDIIEKYNLEDKIILANHFIPDEEVVNYFCAVDIVVQPYKNATQSGVTQIAYHFEKPMLVTKVGGLDEIVPHQKVGYVCEVSSEGVAECLIDFYQNNREKNFIEGIRSEKCKYS